MTVLVTGAAGFIGSATAAALLVRGEHVVGVDNLNDYYTPALKRDRLAPLLETDGFTFHETDIADFDTLKACVSGQELSAIVHLAAQAGVRYSIENPFAYGQANLTGHLSILELARAHKVGHLVYASSSSIYGANTTVPFCEDHKTDAPVSFYGATKKSNELMSESYARLYDIPMTGLRFFTVYGPKGRPDMAVWIFTEKMLKGEPIDVFNRGDMGRDFTYIDDIVDGVVAALDRPPTAAAPPHAVYNLGNDRPENLMTMIELLEKALGVKADMNMREMQAGDVTRTWADISKAKRDLGYQPKVTLEEGLYRFAAWRRTLPAAY